MRGEESRGHSAWLLCGMAACLVACQSAPGSLPEGPLVEVTPAPAPEPVVQVVGVPYPQPVPGQARPWPPAEPTSEQVEEARQEAKTPAQVMDAANEAARQAPMPEGFVNSTLVYDYMPGALYQVWGAPNHLTTLSFAAGEEIYSFAAGDTLRWQVEKTWSGAGAQRQLHLIVQPVRRDLHTTMLVTTSLGTYLFELRSYQHSYLAGVTFRYPHAQLVQLATVSSRAGAGAQQGQADAPARASGTGAGELAVDLSRVEDRYHLVAAGKRLPRWAPRRVFHDGKRTFIDFGRPLGEEELPALFALSPSKEARVVQYTTIGRYMVVGSVLELAVLRMGKERGEQVGIELRAEARR